MITDTKTIWENFSFETPDELQKLQEEQQFPDFFYHSILDSNEMAHYRFYQGKLYLIINSPRKEEHSLQYNTAVLALVVSETELLTIHPKSINLQPLFTTIGTAKIPHIFTEILAYIIDSYGMILRGINTKMLKIEKHVLNSPSNAVLQELFSLQKSIIHFQTTILGLKNICHSIIDSEKKLLWSEELEDDYKNIEIEINQIEKTLSIYDDVLASEMSLSSSILANNLSKTMKTLTTITIVISIPTLITGFYGMNISSLPFQTHPNSLTIVTAISLIITVGSIYYLYRKDLF